MATVRINGVRYEVEGDVSVIDTVDGIVHVNGRPVGSEIPASLTLKVDNDPYAKPVSVEPRRKTESFAKELLAGEITREEAQLCEEARHILYTAVRESMLSGTKKVSIELDMRFAPVIFRAAEKVFDDGWNVNIRHTFTNPLTGVKEGSLLVVAEWSVS